MNITFNDFTTNVIDHVEEQLKHHGWFRGVCIDGLKEYYTINDFEGACENAYCNTLMWDAPNMGFDL